VVELSVSEDALLPQAARLRTSSAASRRAIIFLNFFIKKTSLTFDELILREIS
jgi:hypothetical protein